MIKSADDDPEADAIYDIGTLANVLQLLKLPDGTVKVLVEGVARAKIVSFTGRRRREPWIFWPLSNLSFATALSQSRISY